MCILHSRKYCLELNLVDWPQVVLTFKLADLIWRIAGIRCMQCHDLSLADFNTEFSLHINDSAVLPKFYSSVVIITFNINAIDSLVGIREVGESDSFCSFSNGTAVSHKSAVNPSCIHNTDTSSSTRYTFGRTDESNDLFR